MTSVAIIGGGIAGLAGAHYLHRQGLQVTVLEATDQVGGVIRSESAEGYLIEHGPNTLRAASPLLNDLIETLGLEKDRIEAPSSARNRFIVRGGRLLPLPSSPPGLLSTKLLSLSAKLRLLREPFIPPGDAAETESLADFVRRRFGTEALAYAANPFVAGIFAGDPERLSVAHAFPALLDLERHHGSVLKGMVSKAREKKEHSPGQNPFSFRGGLQRLPAALATQLGDRVLLRSCVTSVQRQAHRWRLTFTHDGHPEQRTFDAVLCTVPLHRLAAMDIGVETDLSPLHGVWYPPVSILALGFRREDVAHPLDGFGFLVPAAETRFRILGTIFSSTLFPDRAPGGHVLLTSLVGGARNLDMALAPTNKLLEVVFEDVKTLLTISAPPTFVRHVVWEQAIPQYEMGYGRIKDLLRTLEEKAPGFFLAGNYVRGISLGDALTSGVEAAQRILS